MSKSDPTTQRIEVPTGRSRYYTNARGVNYYPVMNSQWEKSGYLPRYSSDRSLLTLLGLGAYGFDTSNSFMGSNKTSMWWYYDHNDNEHCLKLLRGLGVNCLRVFLDIYVWQRDRTRFINSLKDFTKLCDKLKMRVQYVIWDGIQINSGYEVIPSGTPQTVSSLEGGLLSTWQCNPHDFEISSAPQAQSFFNTCATPYLNDICSSVSSFQSLWSFDLMNETANTSGASSLVRSTSLHISGLLSSLGIGITFGHGSIYDQYTGTLFGGISNLIYPNSINNLSSHINFVSLHNYIINAYTTAKDIKDHNFSGYQIVGLPYMFNELTDPAAGGWMYKLSEYYGSALGIGFLSFDGMIDYVQSYEPFKHSQGIIFWDGKVRKLLDASSYVDLARAASWFSDKQLNKALVEKDVSIDNGSDGGYYSGVIPQHQSFNSSLYTSTTESKWNIAKTTEYTTRVVVGYDKYTKAKNYPTFAGHPMYPDDTVAFVASGFDLQTYLNICSGYATYFPSLSSYPASLSSGPVFLQRNKEIVLRDISLRNIAVYIMSLTNQPHERLIGTQYDRNITPSAVRLSFSGHYYSSVRTDGSSIALGIVAPTSASTSASIPCVLTNTCIYVTPNTPNTGISWSGYDMYYNTAFSGINQCLSYYLSSTNPNHRLY